MVRANRLVNLWQRTLGVSGFVSLLCVLAAASASLNVVLGYRLGRLTRVQSTRSADRLLRVGAIVPPIAVKRLGGEQEVISYADVGHPTVLYIFTPPCPWCARNLDNLKTLVDKKSSEYRIIGLSMTDQGLADYVLKNQLKLPVYSGLPTQAKDAYNLSRTPQTIVVSPEGRVLQNWTGAYAGDQKSQVEAFFHVTLPGLRKLQEENEKKTTN
jgi:hypothetical protein